MKSIHVIYGSAQTETAVRAHILAVEQQNAFVHEIEHDEDIRLVLASSYDRCIAIISAEDEAMARDQLLQRAAAVHAKLCAVTFEASQLQA